MKQRWMITAIMGGAATLALAIAPLMSNAQTPTNPAVTAQTPAERNPGRGPGHGGHRALEEILDLTEAQQAEMQRIRQNTHDQMATVLTDDQRQSLQAGLDAGEPFPQVMRSLELTEGQRSQLREIMESSMEQHRALLTEEQRATLQEQMQNHMNRRGEGRGGMGRGHDGMGRGADMGPGAGEAF